MKKNLLAALTAIAFMACKKEPATVKPAGAQDPPLQVATQAAGDKYMFLTEQSQDRYGFVNVTQNVWWWTWKAGVNNNIPAGSVAWFDGPNEIKPVFNQQYVLIGGQGGGVAIVRISDKQAVFYAHIAGGNIHSLEILPDGNLVAASIGPHTSPNDDDYLIVFKVGANYPYNIYTSRVLFPGVHNVVWDRTRQCLWAAGTTDLKKFSYSFNCTSPSISQTLSVPLPVQPGNAHELFPVYGKDSLFLSTGGKLWYVDPQLMPASPFIYIKDMAGVKSISSGPSGYANCVQKCISDSEYWNDQISDMGNLSPVYQETGTKIYKGRWKVDNLFSYPAVHNYTVCN